LLLPCGKVLKIPRRLFFSIFDFWFSCAFWFGEFWGMATVDKGIPVFDKLFGEAHFVFLPVLIDFFGFTALSEVESYHKGKTRRYDGYEYGIES
jgi:hypothetical protein